MSASRKPHAERQATAAAERIGRARATGEQLSLLAPAAPPAAAAPAAQGEGERRVGRPLGSRNRATRAELRKLFAARGWRMPEDLLAGLAGLDLEGGDFIEQTMAQAERVLAWAQQGEATPAQRLALFLQLHGERRRALEALLPYGLAKVTPDQGGAPASTFIMLPTPPAQGGPGDQAQLVEGVARPVGPSEFAPPPLPAGFEQNQWLADDDDAEGEA